MAPICVRTRCCTSAKNWEEGMAEGGWLAVESVTKAKGRWPLRAVWRQGVSYWSGEGWRWRYGDPYRQGCLLRSILRSAGGKKWPARLRLRRYLVSIRDKMYLWMELTSAESMGSHIDNVVRSGHDGDVALLINHA